MSKINFYLDKNRIFLHYFFTQKSRLKIYVKEKVKGSTFWDPKKQRVKSQHPHSQKVNEYLDTLESYVHSVRLDAFITGVGFNQAYLRRMVEERLRGSSNTFYDYALIWLSRKIDVKPLTVQTYTISVEKINSIVPGITFEGVSRYTHHELYKSLLDARYKTNYINRIFKVFRSIINDAYVDGIHTNKFHLSKGFVPGVEDVDSVYLNLEELNTLFNLWSSATLAPYHQNALNIFLRGCYTGQRHQTYSKFVRTMIYNVGGVDMLNIKQEKTGVSVSIPLSDKFGELMKVEVKPISRQKLGDYIKDVCKCAGLDTYEKISTHTARRTFATNMVLAGVDITKIMSITGHKTEKEFRKYVKIDTVVNAQRTLDEINVVFGNIQ